MEKHAALPRVTFTNGDTVKKIYFIVTYIRYLLSMFFLYTANIGLIHQVIFMYSTGYTKD
jgi:hypothetical protein